MKQIVLFAAVSLFSLASFAQGDKVGGGRQLENGGGSSVGRGLTTGGMGNGIIGAGSHGGGNGLTTGRGVNNAVVQGGGSSTHGLTAFSGDGAGCRGGITGKSSKQAFYARLVGGDKGNG